MSEFSPHSALTCSVWFSEQTENIFVNSFKLIVCGVMRQVFCVILSVLISDAVNDDDNNNNNNNNYYYYYTP